ncbi:MAG: FkbM family methyltransferase, partial [Dolichospermum sp.]
VCVEPDPVLFSKIRSRRRRDICLNIGIGIDENRSANFYVMTSSTLNTFSRAEAEKYQSFNKARIREVVNLPLITINNLIKENFKSYPNFISLDIEGWDFKVIQTFDFQLFRPEVFCIETIEVTEYKSERKVIEIIDFMKHNKYLAFADTYVNTIFVDQEKWVSRH